MRHLGLMLVVVGCGEPTAKPPDPPVEEPSSTVTIAEPPSPSSTTSDSTTLCLISVVEAAPADGEVGVYYRAPVRVELTLPDPTATIVVSDAEGGVPGTSTVDDRTVTWTGDPLVPEREYTVHVGHACGAETLAFTTSDVGLPVEAELRGRVYGLDVAGGLWTAPVGGGPVFAALFSQYRLLVGVTDTTDPATMDLITAIGGDGEQNDCAPSVDLLDAVWTDPYFEVASARVELQTETFGLVIDDFSLSGAFSTDGARMDGAVLTGIVDTRGLGEEFGVGQGPEAVCDVVATLGVSCTPCVDGLVYCLDMRVEGVDAPEVPIPLRPITAEEVSANPACD